MRTLRRCTPWICAGGLLWANGCLATIERGVDLVLSPGSLDNAAILPYTALAGLALVLQQLWYGT